MFDDRPPEPEVLENVPTYIYQCYVSNIVDGDTVDVYFDVGFETFMTERVRIRDIDTGEIHFTDTESEEYISGMKHKTFFKEWVEASESTGRIWPFILYSEEYTRGAYGRVIGDLYSRELDEWWSTAVIEEFDDVERYNE